ncbi:MAG: Fpg/Nei family DNA glycosylase [Stackebrandtia sp.]
MPEGHVIHRLANRYRAEFAGRPTAVSSPQGRFAASAERLDGLELLGAEAHGKQLFMEFEGAQWIRIHLGIYGKVEFGPAPAPAPRGVIRLRLETEAGYSDLRGPAACELIDSSEKAAAHARLGPDPLRADADPDRAWRTVSASGRDIGSLLMDQAVVSGVGNIYRAEVLFRHGIDPRRPGRSIAKSEWDDIWLDLAELMADGVKLGRIDTVRADHTPEAMGREPRVDAHGGEVYVYRRDGKPCLICGTEVALAKRQGRNLFWCPSCQAA